MRIASIIFLLVFLSIKSQAQTTSQMVDEAHKELDKAEERLNTVYKRILELYKKDTLFISKMRKAERLWIQFRDAEIEMKYPHMGTLDYGQEGRICLVEYKLELTEARERKLRQWLVRNIDETNHCNGSVGRYKDE
ncbi:MAG: DUF1311 domain-containing protein [Pseudopedobacter saltans]|uniref:DUF1311 domain-containing protein n=1 Tax=Pseudopedobacter saltans TaxID=151895 RepID=A0A2W5F7W1_9SPHI|nr:MAG: DUF1311 domain-containing protein [Pseudopedobacter saltans]